MEVSEPKSTQEPAASPATRSTDANGPALHFLLGAQRILVEEMVFSAEATLDRIRTEIHLFGEFASKLAESHSVLDWKKMGQECGRHQLEFVRRDCDRMFRHGERLIDATAALLSNRP